RLEGRRVAGIVMISDGQPTTGSESGNRLNAARDYVRQRGIPVFGVSVGDPVPPQNIAMVRLQGPAEVRKGSAIELKAYMSNRNCAGLDVEIRLLRRPVNADEEWAETGVTKQVTLSGEAGSTRSEAQEVTLVVPKAGELGEFFYKAEVKPLAREFSDEDNAATTKIRVSEEKIKILFVSGDAGWEFQRLRSFLLNNPDRYAVSVWQQDAEAKFNQESSTEKMRLKQLPRTRKELFNYDTVILYDPAYTKDGFDGQFVGMLESFVSDHHGGLCYIVSNKNSDRILTGSGPFKPLSALLPVVLGQRSGDIVHRIASGQPTSWVMTPTALGLEHPATRLGGRRSEETESIWEILPGVYWTHPVVSLKPLASALTVSSDPTDRMSGPDGEPTPL
ncbi:MAG: VWA domain-containing protein, partial [Phycisphaerae bacterium]|nr:VWA domain-containing protein [Phycisphaerae bacterium]